MDAYVKIKGIDSPRLVHKVSKVISISTANSQLVEIIDFEKLRISLRGYYVFVGEEILHVWGQNVDFVEFH